MLSIRTISHYDVVDDIITMLPFTQYCIHVHVGQQLKQTC